MLNKIFGAIAGVALSMVPAAAYVDPNTPALLDYVHSSGIIVSINTHPECKTNKFHGVYIHRGMQRQLVLCPGDKITGFDHAVVRHEVWHAIQHCVNVARDTHLTTPVNQDTRELMEYVNNNLTRQQIERIQHNYPRDKWLLEFEADLAMILLTADDITQLFKEACIAD